MDHDNYTYVKMKDNQVQQLKSIKGIRGLMEVSIDDHFRKLKTLVRR